MLNLRGRVLVSILLATIAVIVASVVVALVLLQLPGRNLGLQFGVIIASLIIIAYLASLMIIHGILNTLLSKYSILPSLEKELIENERQMLAEQLNYSKEMEAVGHLTRGIAHDLNNILTIVDGYSSLIIADPDSAETKENAQQILSAARRATSMTRKLLGFDKKAESPDVAINVNIALQNNSKILTEILDEKIKLTIKTAPDPIFAAISAAHLGQIMMNLVVNACEAMNNKGEVIVEAKLVDLEKLNLAQSIVPTSGKFVQISVIDDGVGISSENMKKIFEPFFSTKGDGLGLGLAIVKNILSQINGAINWESQLGKGSVFQIFLPVVSEGTEHIETTILPVQKKKKNVSKKDASTILLVEDDEMIQSLLVATLESEQYHVLIANNGVEAEALVKEYKNEIQLLFTDVTMRDLDGVELAKIVRGRYPDIKLLFMSGYSSKKAIGNEFVDDYAFLKKPFMPDKVISAVHELLKK